MLGLFGNDVYVSYSRLDGIDYALGLANELTKRKLICEHDQHGSPPGAEVPEAVLRQVERSLLLVVVATDAAGTSKNVLQEVERFLKTRRAIIPISFEGSLERSPLFKSLAGMAIREESKEALNDHQPSALTIDRIVNAVGARSRNTILRRLATFTALGIAALVATGWFLLQQQAGRFVDLNAGLDRERAFVAAVRTANDAEILRGGDGRALEESVRRAANALRMSRAVGRIYVEADRTLRRGLELLRPVVASIAEGSHAVFSRDGRYLAVSGGGVKVWKIGDAAPVSGERALSGAASEIAFLPDGRLAIAEAADVKMCAGWEDGRPNCASALRYDGTALLSNDGRWFASFEPGSQSVRFHDLVADSGAEITVPELDPLRENIIAKLLPAEYQPYIKPTVIGAVGADGVLAFAVEQKLYLRRLPSGEPIVLPREFADVRNVGFSPNGRSLVLVVGDAVAASGLAMVLLDPSTWQERARYAMPEGATESIALDAAESLAAVGDTASSIMIWDVAARRVVARLYQQDWTAFALSATGRHVAAAGAGVRVWDLDPARSHQPLRIDGTFWKFTASADGRRVAASGRETTEFWDVAARKRISTLPTPEDWYRTDGAHFTSGGTMFLVPKFSAMIRVSDGQMTTLPQDTKASFTADDRLTASFGSSRPVEIREVGSDIVRARIPQSENARTALLSPRGSYVAVVAADGVLTIWSLAQGREPQRVYTFDATFPDRVIWSPDEKTIAVAHSSILGGASIQLRDLETKAERASGPATSNWFGLEQKPGAAFSANGSTFIAPAEGRRIWICDVGGGWKHWIAEGSSDIRDISVSPDGRAVALLLGDRTIEVWHVALRSVIARIGLSSLPDSLHFSANGRLLITTGEESDVGLVRYWLWRPEDLIAEAGIRAPRGQVATPAAAAPSP